MPESIARSALVLLTCWCSSIHADEPAQREEVLLEHGKFVVSLAFSSDGERLLSTGGLELRLWDLSTHELLTEGQRSPLGDGFFFADGRFAVVGKGLHVYSADAEPLSSREADVLRTEASAGNSLYAYAEEDSGAIEIRRVSDDHLVHTLDKDAGVLAMSRDDAVLASGNEGMVTLWDVERGEALLEIEADKLLVRHVNLSPDASMVGTAGSDGCSVWSVSDGKGVSALEDTEYCNRVAFVGSDAQLVLSQSGMFHGTQLALHDVSTGAIVQKLHHHKGSAEGLAVSRDGMRVAASTGDGTIGLWRINSSPTGKEDLSLCEDLVHTLLEAPSCQEVGERMRNFIYSRLHAIAVGPEDALSSCPEAKELKSKLKDCTESSDLLDVVFEVGTVVEKVQALESWPPSDAEIAQLYLSWLNSRLNTWHKTHHRFPQSEETCSESGLQAELWTQLGIVAISGAPPVTLCYRGAEKRFAIEATVHAERYCARGWVTTINAQSEDGSRANLGTGPITSSPKRLEDGEACELAEP